MTRDFFAHKAGDYEQNTRRVSNVDNIARAVIDNTRLSDNMHLMDFGAGTGLLLERIAPHVKKITAVDISPSMITQLENKRDSLECTLEILQLNMEIEDALGIYDGVISSMTTHHIKDVAALFRKFYALVKPGGFIAIADLDKEDGSFHTEDTGVFHFGFDRSEITAIAEAAGFRQVAVYDASMMHKPQGDYGVFLLTAIR